jgi:hypothetical protein
VRDIDAIADDHLRRSLLDSERMNDVPLSRRRANDLAMVVRRTVLMDSAALTAPAVYSDSPARM